MREVWSGKPVRGLVHVPDVPTAYAFTADEFFELREPIQTHRHGFRELRDATADEALQTVANFAQAIKSLGR